MTRQQQLDERNRRALERMGISSPKQYRVKVFYSLNDEVGDRIKTYIVKARDKRDARDQAISQFKQNEYDLNISSYGTHPSIMEVEV